MLLCDDLQPREKPVVDGSSPEPAPLSPAWAKDAPLRRRTVGGVIPKDGLGQRMNKKLVRCAVELMTNTMALIFVICACNGLSKHVQRSGKQTPGPGHYDAVTKDRSAAATIHPGKNTSVRSCTQDSHKR